MRLFEFSLAAAALGLAACADSQPRSAAASPPGAGAPIAMTVYKSPTCGCCAKWVDHVRAAGFVVTVRDTADVTPIKVANSVPEAAYSCHTAVVDGYVIEGHVPADVIRRLLRERPTVVGIAAPGMPAGSPGMEGMFSQRYDVVTFDRAGKTAVYETR